MAAFAPMPMASDSTAIAEKAGCRRSERSPWRTSRTRCSMRAARNTSRAPSRIVPRHRIGSTPAAALRPAPCRRAGSSRSAARHGSGSRRRACPRVPAGQPSPRLRRDAATDTRAHPSAPLKNSQPPTTNSQFPRKMLGVGGWKLGVDKVLHAFEFTSSRPEPG